MNNISFTDVNRYVIGFFSKHPVKVLLAYIATSLFVAFELVKPWATEGLINAVTTADAVGKGEIYKALQWALYLAGTSLSAYFFHYLALTINCYTDSAVERAVSTRALRHIHTLDHHWLIENFAGALVTKIKRGMMSVHTYFDVICYSIYPALITTIGVVVMVWFKNPLFSVFILGFSACYMVLTIYLTFRFVTPARRHANERENKAGGFLADSFSGHRDVKAFASEKEENEKYDRISNKWMIAARSSWMRGNELGLAQYVLLIALLLGLLGYALYLWSRGDFTAGEVVFILTSYQVLASSLERIGAHLRQLIESVNNIEDVVRIDHLRATIYDHSEAKALTIQKAGLALNNVRFEYPGAAVLKDFSLKIEPEQKCGLIGPSGAGKSTLVNLLLRLYEPQDGIIAVNGQDIRNIALECLRRSISYIPQDTSLFHRSLMDNIRYGRLDASDEEVIEAAKKARAHEFISGLPQKYRTLVGERGVKLSGGQRQRVAIARAILKDAPILILDEATSALDSESEKRIQESLKELMEGKTVIAIAHRLSTIAHLDRLIVMDKGRIVEDGTHENLLKHGGLYARLWHMQSGGFLGE